jgi:hypothetical protein
METPPDQHDENPAETDESEMTGSAEPGTVATPEGTPEVDAPAVDEEQEVDEELEDRGDV